MTSQILDKMLPFVLPGLLYGVGAIGLALPLRFLAFPDLTTMNSLMLGGISCIFMTLRAGPFIGLIAGCVTGGALGATTGFLSQVMRIPPVLAGIITFTASLTPAFLLSSGGHVGLPRQTYALLSPVFSTSDTSIVIVVAVAIVITITVYVTTKPGVLLLALVAAPAFVHTRHRYRRATFFVTLIFSKSIVGLAGALYALNAREANVASHVDFLTFALGAIFGGEFSIAFIAYVLRHLRHKPQASMSGADPATRFLGALRVAMVDDSNQPLYLAVLLISFVVGGLFLTEIAGLVNANAWAAVSPRLAISPDFQYLITAAVIAFLAFAAQQLRK